MRIRSVGQVVARRLGCRVSAYETARKEEAERERKMRERWREMKMERKSRSEGNVMKDKHQLKISILN